MVSQRSLMCCFGLFFLVAPNPVSTFETEAAQPRVLRQGRQSSHRKEDILKRRRRSTAFASIRVINKTGREVYIAYMNHYRSPQPYTILRRNEKKSFKSRIYTTWYAYQNSFSNYMLMNGKSRFMVLRKHLYRTIDVMIQSRDGTPPATIPRRFSEKYIELMVIADSTMYEKYGENTEKYILTIVNQGRRHFQDPSFGGMKLNIVVTRVEIIRKKENDFKITANAPRQNMVSACNFAAGFNVPSDYDDRHFDFSVIFTRRKFGYSGYTPMFQMCKSSYSCTLINDRGLALAHVVAHEIGHSLGVDHDGQHNNCTLDGLKGSLMGKILYSRLDNYYWSRCSREQFVQTLGYFHCLNDKPRVNITRFMSKLPGVVMNRNEQCKLRYAKHYTACTKYMHPYYDCKATYCAPDWDTTKCLYYSRPPLDGSKCNRGKGWCIKGVCYPYGRSTFYPIDGGWSTWQPWGACSANCGIGLRYRTRKCDNPRPKHNGKKCLGNEKEAMACKTKDCPIAETVTDIRHKYCRSLRDEKWIWLTQGRAYEIVSTTDGINCTFEYNCSWTESVNDEFNWTRTSGKTPSHGTGPSEDHTFRNESGHYVFIEASTGEGDELRREGFRARLMSPLIRLPEVCLTFYYHMLGSHIGSLSVSKRSSEEEIIVWKHTEEMGDAWHKGEVDIANSKAFEIYFEAVRGRHYQGDIAIDDIMVTPGKCSSSDSLVSNPCMISCTDADGTRFLENITLPDTYRCHTDDRLDICISGKCKKLGCDLKLGSNKTIDSCMICNGNNSQCVLSEGQSIIRLNSTGETTLLDLPQKSTSIHIEVAAASYDAVGIKSRDTSTYFPARSVKNDLSSEYVVIHNQTFNFAFNSGAVAIRSDGPSNVPIKIVIAQSEQPEVKLKYQMFVPTGSRNSP